MPNLLCSITSLESYFALEDSIVDPQTKTLTLKTQNITFSSLVSAKEVCTYRACETDATQTEYIWNLEVATVRHFPIINSRIEQLLLKQASAKAKKGLKIMQELSAENIEIAKEMPLTLTHAMNQTEQTTTESKQRRYSILSNFFQRDKIII